MVPCPKGAIVRHSELAVICDAVERAIEFVEIEISSDFVPNRRLRTAEDTKLERQRKLLLSSFRRVHKELRRLGADRPKIQLTEKGRAALAQGARP